MTLTSKLLIATTLFVVVPLAIAMWYSMYKHIVVDSRRRLATMELDHAARRLELESQIRYLQGRLMPDDDRSHYRHGL